MKAILIVDDDIHIGNLLEELLNREGYLVFRAYSGTEAVLFLKDTTPDLILLDLMLPGLSGEELLPYSKGIPVIIVSAKIDIDDKVSLLLNGAADYITKPFQTKELLARVAVQLRKTDIPIASSLLVFDEITLNTDTYTTTVQGIDVKLTKTEYAILKLLLQHPAQVITKSVLLEVISADTLDCSESSLKITNMHLQ